MDTPRPGPAAGAEWSGSADLTLPDHVPTVAGLLRHAVATHPDNLAVATPDEQLTYAELDRRSATLAAHLVTLGVGKGSRVGTLLPNGAGWVVAWAAITRIGAISTPVNTFSKAPELATLLRHADVQVLIATPAFDPHDYVERLLDIAPSLASATADRPLLLPELPQLRHVLFWDHSEVAWAESDLGPRLEPGPDVHLASIVSAMEDAVVPADPMLITYTSGSTGEPKGVVHGQGPLLRHARNLAAMSGIGPTDRIWTPMPLCWVGGFSFTLLRALSVGAGFVTQPRMDPGVALRLLERHRVTCVSAWPAIGATLSAHPAYPMTDLSALRLGTFWEGRAPEHRPADPGLSVTSLGMSESGGPHTFWTLEDDRGYFRDGWFFFTGRRSDLIKTKGANVAPAEVEAVLRSCDGVSATFVFGVDHAQRGQDVVALVVADGITPDSLTESLRAHLSSYKVPRDLFAIGAEEVPYLTSQKPDRRSLASLADRLTTTARGAR